MKMYQIGEVAERVGLSLKTIRHYDEMGIVPPSGRTAGGFRLYTERDIRRFLFLKPFKPLGVGLDDVRAILEALDELEALESGAVVAAPEAVDALADRLAGYARMLEARSVELRAELVDAERMAELLATRAQVARRAGGVELRR
ncbi:MAG: MerR family transcriptional regulator [Acidimicrobiales bacterium]